MGSSSPSPRAEPIHKENGNFFLPPHAPPERELTENQCRDVFKRAKKRNIETWFPDGARKGVIPHGGIARVTIPQSQPRQLQVIPDLKPLPEFTRFKASQEQIQGLKQNNDKSRVLQCSSVYPYCAVGIVSHSQGSGSESFGMGSGSIVGPQQILTCAHVVIDERTKELRENICFTPAPLFPARMGVYKVKNVYFNRKFLDHDLSHPGKIQYFYLYDYALIELDTTDNLEEIYGSLGFDFGWDMNTVDQELFLIGYPIIKGSPVFTELCGNTIVDDQVIRHKMDTYYGSSGSPIIEYRHKESSWIIRGIHNSQDNVCKSGVPLSQRMLQDLQTMMSVPYVSYIFAGYYNSDTIIGLRGLEYFNKYLSQSNLSEDIRELDLNNNNIGDKGCLLLKMIDGLKNLTSIHLELNNIGPSGCEELVRADWPQLERIALWSNAIGDQGCKFLKKGIWPNLKFIDLNGDNIGPVGCSYLKTSQWPNLEVFYFWNNHIGNKGCEYLSECSWPKLKALNIQLNSITLEGCLSLSKAKWDLKKLCIWSNDIGHEGYQVLRSKGWQVQWKN